MVIHNDLYDQRRTCDVPCTLTLQFLIRQGRLDMIVNMRSNDLLWGFSYDITQFAFVQRLLAMCL
jgi:thymidylate synthase